jgi:sugar (pentulose or hexulose) kinase
LEAFNHKEHTFAAQREEIDRLRERLKEALKMVSVCGGGLQKNWAKQTRAEVFGQEGK